MKKKEKKVGRCDLSFVLKQMDKNNWSKDRLWKEISSVIINSTQDITIILSAVSMNIYLRIHYEV